MKLLRQTDESVMTITLEGTIKEFKQLKSVVQYNVTLANSLADTNLEIDDTDIKRLFSDLFTSLKEALA